MTKKIKFYYKGKNNFVKNDENETRPIYADKDLKKKIGIFQLLSIKNVEVEMSTNTATVFFDNGYKLVYVYVRNGGEQIETEPIYSSDLKIKKIKRKLVTEFVREVTIYLE